MVDDFKRHLEAQHVGKLCSHLVHSFITKPFRDSELHVATSPPHLPPPWAHMEKKGSPGSVPTPTCPPAAASNRRDGSMRRNINTPCKSSGSAQALNSCEVAH